jgi:hypothetical protein
MEDLVNLLDVCNVLRESMSEMKKHNMSVQIALHGLLHAHAQIPSALSHDHMMNNQVVKAKNSLIRQNSTKYVIFAITPFLRGSK